MESKFKKVNLYLFNNDWYKPHKNNIVPIVWYLFNIIFLLNPFNPFSSLKILVLKIFGAKIGKGVVIKQSVNIKYPWKLEIGNNCWIGENVWIDNLAFVKIGNNVCISQGAMLLTGNHDYKKISFDLMIGKIILEDGVWIGAKSIVCPNVICHEHSVLTVGSIATKNLDSYSIYHTNESYKIKKREIF